MWFVVILALIVLSVCLAGDSQKNKWGTLGVIAAILFFPIGIIMALTKKYK